MTEKRLTVLDRLGWAATIGMSLVPLVPYAIG